MTITVKLTDYQEKRFAKTLEYYQNITHKDGFGNNGRNELEDKFNKDILDYLKMTYFRYVASASGICYMKRLSELQDFFIKEKIVNDSEYNILTQNISTEITTAIQDLAKLPFDHNNFPLFELLMERPEFECCFSEIEAGTQLEFIRQLKMHALPQASHALKLRKICHETNYSGDGVDYRFCPVLKGCILILRYDFTYSHLFLEFTSEEEQLLKQNLVTYLRCYSIPAGKHVYIKKIQVNRLVFIQDKLEYTSVHDFVEAVFTQLNS